jgi:hypothetical protein
VKDHGAPAHGAQLGNGALVRAGLAQCHAIQVGHLVTADDDGLRVAPRDRAGFGMREPTREGGRGFAGQRRFVHVGRGGVERQLQALEQRTPVRRSRAEDQRTG